MKIARKIIRYIIAFVLSVSIISYFLVKLASSTILSESYILAKLEETNYYEKILEEVKSNFEKYIYQSGMDEEIIENIVSEDRIKEDTKLILNNIYDGLEEKINAQTIKDSLNSNIEKSLGKKTVQSQKNQIDKFVETISEEYLNTISNTGYEKQINNYYTTIQKNISRAEKILLIVIALGIAALFIFSIKRIYKALVALGISLTTSGLFYIFVSIYIMEKTKIGNILILNDAISIVIRNILNELLSNITNYGLVFIGTGIVLIIVPNAIHYIAKYRKEKKNKKVETV